MAIKVDLEKAYDKLEWSFIRDFLVNANLPHNLVMLIMSCLPCPLPFCSIVGMLITSSHLVALDKVILFPLTFSSFAWKS